MSFHLKQQRRPKGLYLQLVESKWDPATQRSVQVTVSTPGYVSKLQKDGIADPVAFYTKCAQDLNAFQKREREKRSAEKISETPERHCGYFPLKQMWNHLELQGFLNLLQKPRNFQFRITEMLQAMIYALVLQPASKQRSLQEVVPLLYEKYAFSYDQLLSGLEFLGGEYEKVIEIFNHQIRKKFEIVTDKVFMDCTNFYFEIDREDDLRRKGPSKEKRHDPLIGLGLLLDAHLLPFAMHLYPGNGSEQPVLRKMIADMKQRACIQGRTIQVADKGLNCARNIMAAIADGDGYIFSRGVKKLSKVERKWVFGKQGWAAVGDPVHGKGYYIKECEADFAYQYYEADGRLRRFSVPEKRIVTFNPSLARKQRLEIDKLVAKAQSLSTSQAKQKEYGDAAKYVQFTAIDKNGQESSDKVCPQINEKKIQEDREAAGFNQIVTSELKMDRVEIYDVYHCLWRIEETFKCLKTYLEARPVYLQKPSRIFGHFLICYLAIVLIRLLQYFVLDHEYESEQLFRFMRSFEVVHTKSDGWINLMSASEMVSFMSQKFACPITNYFMTTQQLNALFSKKKVPR